MRIMKSLETLSMSTFEHIPVIIETSDSAIDTSQQSSKITHSFHLPFLMVTVAYLFAGAPEPEASWPSSSTLVTSASCSASGTLVGSRDRPARYASRASTYFSHRNKDRPCIAQHHHGHMHSTQARSFCMVVILLWLCNCQCTWQQVPMCNSKVST